MFAKRWIGPLLTGMLVISAGLAYCRAEETDAVSRPFHREKNIVVAEAHGVGVLMDVFTPTGEKNGLAIIDVVSGAFFSDPGKMRDHDRAQIFDIACRRGYTVFAVRPGSVTKFSLDEMIKHIQLAIRWVKDHSEDYGIDPDRIGLMGASAGGYLASQTAITAGEADRVAAVGVFFPPTDFLDYRDGPVDVRDEGQGGQFFRRLLFPSGVEKLDDARIEKQLRKMSPAHQASKDCPPFLLIHGDADTTVPLAQSEKLRDALEEHGVDVTLIVKEGGGHPWPTIAEEVAKLVDWFDAKLKPQP